MQIERSNSEAFAFKAVLVGLCTLQLPGKYFGNSSCASYFRSNNSFTNNRGFARHGNDPKMVVLLDKLIEDWSGKRGQDDSSFQQRKLACKRLGKQPLNLGLAAAL